MTPRGPAGARRSGMREVAERAGVALSSVSRVLSGHPDVSPVMRNRVLDAVSALGYEPDLLAQSLRKGATMSIGFVVSDISNPLFAEIALGAETALQERGYSLLLTNSVRRPDLDVEHVKMLARRRVDGILLSVSDETHEGSRRTMASLSMPVVLVDRDLPGIRSAVLADHAGGIAQAAAHLIGLGHRSIALVNGDLKVRPSRERASALRRACRAAGVTAVVRNGSFDAEHGHRATGALLDAAAPPTAVIAGSNQILVGVLRAVRERGLAVPTDVSLVTCDDIALTEFLDPALATIRRDTRGMGRASAELLLDLIDGGAPRTQTLETSFAAKESCAAPPRGPR